jgi:hypothetical protein
MRAMFRGMLCALVVASIAGCATPDTTDVDSGHASDERAARDTAAILMESAGVRFRGGDGTEFRPDTIVTLPTGGPPRGRLIPASTLDDVSLYVTRDGTVPSAANNWGGPIDPRDPRPISRPFEGVVSYRVVAGLDGAYSEPFTLTVIWQDESDPVVERPEYFVDGLPVAGQATIRVSAGDDASARLAIACGYTSATLYITRDGSPPSSDNHWRSQPCEGTYLWSPESTLADYRAIAVWNGVRSPAASLRVEWID